MAKDAISDQILGFEMSEETKGKWLSTRKKGKPVGNSGDILRLPGLFETVGYSQDKSLFIIAMLLEIAGFLLISALANFGVLIAAIVAAFIVIDVFLAIGIHWKYFKHGKQTAGYSICEFENRIAIDKTDAGKLKGWKNWLNKSQNWFFKYLFIVILWTLAIAKAGAIFVLNTEAYVFGILAFLLYGFIAFVHMNNTGFFLAEARRKRSYKKELNQFTNSRTLRDEEKDEEIKSTETKQYREYELSDKIPDDIKPVKIKKAGKFNEDTVYNAILKDGDKWKLFTWGLLEDEDLQDLLVGNDNLKKYIAVECLKAQLNMLESNAKNLGGTEISKVDKLIELNYKTDETQ
jgi:hypothetical protein